GGSASSTPFTLIPEATVRHWNRSQIQENRPPAMAYDRAFSVSNTGNRPARSQLSNRWVKRIVMSEAPFHMPARSPNTMFPMPVPLATVLRAGGPMNSCEKLNTGENRNVFSRLLPGFWKFGPMMPAPAEYLVSYRCSQLIEKLHPFSSRYPKVTRWPGDQPVRPNSLLLRASSPLPTKAPAVPVNRPAESTNPRTATRWWPMARGWFIRRNSAAVYQPEP